MAFSLLTSAVDKEGDRVSVVDLDGKVVSITDREGDRASVSDKGIPGLVTGEAVGLLLCLTYQKIYTS
jgi:hypothetical protein